MISSQSWRPSRATCLPDVSIATALGATPFKHVPHALSDEAMELAASTKFREIVHRFKDVNGIGPAESLHWQDNGDVYSNGIFVDNFHDYQD